MRGCKEDEASPSLFCDAQCQNQRQWTQWMCGLQSLGLGAKDVGVSSLEIFKSFLDMMLFTLLWVALLEQELDKMDSDVSSSFCHAVILCL